MAKSHDDWITAAIAVLSPMAVGALLALSAADTAPADSWLKRWETLTAGFLAVIAAGVTVAAMLLTDNRAQARHEEILRLNLRMDRLRARRAAFPYARMIVTKANHLLEHVEAAAHGVEHSRLGELKNAIRAQKDLIKIVKDEPIAEAKDMFGSDMAFSYKSLLDTVVGLGTLLGQAHAHTAAKADREAMIVLTESAALAARRAQKGCAEFAAQLEELAGHYGK